MARYIARRKFLATLVDGAVVAWPVAARAQQSGRLIRIGVLGPTLNNPPAMEQYQAFRTQLAELGFREGQNLTIDYGHLDDPRGPFVVAAELVRSRPDLIVTAGPETSLQAVVGASGFIPVVMIAFNFDPLARGYIPSLARPDGNITGLVFQQLELAQKQVELLTQAFPDRTRLAMLFDAEAAAPAGSAPWRSPMLDDEHGRQAPLVDRDDKHFHCIEAIHAVSAGEGPWGSRVVKPCGDPELKYPITGVCCARAASGHAAAPPSSAMKSRRFIIRSPRRRAGGLRLAG